MNARLARNKQNHTAIYWEPFATSTPLKAVPNNSEIGQVFQKQLILHGAPVNVVEKLQNGFTSSLVFQNKCTGSNFPKRTRTNSSAYFDILTTSSSDEDDSAENKKRPVIKLSSRKKTRTLASFKTLGSEETEILNAGNPENKLGNCKKLKTTAEKHVVSAVKDFKHKSQSPKGKDGVQYQTPRSCSNFNNKSRSSDEENRIFNETKSYKKTMGTIKSCLKSKENGIKIALLNGNLGKHELKELHEMSNSPAKSNRGIFEEEEGSCKTVSEDNKVIKRPPKKVKKLTNTIDPVKKTRSRKIPDKLPAGPSQPVGNTEALLHSWKRNHNLSHQLFSDSKEQEFINMLDLTREENNEAAEAVKCSVQETENDLPLKSFMSPHPSIQNICTNKIEPERPKRTKQAPKKFWLPENAPEKPLHIVAAKKQKKMRTKSSDPIHETEVLKKLKETSTNDNNFKNNTGREHACAERQKFEKKGKKAEKEIIEPYNVLNINDIKTEDPEQNHLPPKTHRSRDVESNQNSFAITKDGNRINLDRPVFKRLNELSYGTNETGCSVGQHWNLNNFKCGIFRLKIKAQFACKTLHKNSYLGGVLVKGDLRMKIGEKDLHLKEGDMAFVPPLTKWQATNIGDCESVFYYWCGRFTGNIASQEESSAD